MTVTSIIGNFFLRKSCFNDGFNPLPGLLEGGEECPMPNVFENLASHLKNRRKQAGISQEELARQTGISLTLIRDIERKAANPTLSSLAKIADAFDISIAELLDFNNELKDSAKISSTLVKELRQLPPDKLRLMLEFIRIATM